MSSTEKGKKQAAIEAIKYIKDYSIIGVGTGSTVNYFIQELGKMKGQIEYAVSSSESTTALLKKENIPIIELNACGNLDIYVDGADEATVQKNLIKGGGGALTREKIVANASKRFICIICKISKIFAIPLFKIMI